MCGPVRATAPEGGSLRGPGGIKTELNWQVAPHTSTNSNYYKRQSVLGVLKSALRNVAKMQSAAGQALKVRPSCALTYAAARTH